MDKFSCGSYFVSNYVKGGHHRLFAHYYLNTPIEVKIVNIFNTSLFSYYSKAIRISDIKIIFDDGKYYRDYILQGNYRIPLNSLTL